MSTRGQAASVSDRQEAERQRLITKRVTTETNDEDDEKDEKGSTMLIAFISMLVFALGNRIFGRLYTFPMHNYPIFMNLLSTFYFIPICYFYIVPMIYFTDTITKEQRAIPKYKFAVMGAYDSIAGIMASFAVNYISSSSIIVLVQQSAIPISMLISYIALNSVYTTAQYVGAGVVLFGIFVVLLPTLNGSSHASSGASDSSELVWIAVLVASCVPMCLSSVYKEKALGETEIDVIYLNGWVAVFQSLIAIPLCIPSSYVVHIPLSQILPNIYSGFLCMGGVNTVTESHNPNNMPLDHCETAPMFVTLFLVFNVVYNYLIVVILKLGSANILWMASTVIVPLSNVAFSLKFMPGSKPLTVFDITGLFVIMTGLVIYRFCPQLIALWVYVSCQREDEDDSFIKKRVRRISKAIERKQLKFVGFNQIEALNTLVDSRVYREQRMALYRTPQQIRGNLLYRLGIPPSPQIMLAQDGPRLSFIEKGGNGRNAVGVAEVENPVQRSGSFANSNNVAANNPRAKTMLMMTTMNNSGNNSGNYGAVDH